MCIADEVGTNTKRFSDSDIHLEGEGDGLKTRNIKLQVYYIHTDQTGGA